MIERAFGHTLAANILGLGIDGVLIAPQFYFRHRAVDILVLARNGTLIIVEVKWGKATLSALRQTTAYYELFCRSQDAARRAIAEHRAGDNPVRSKSMEELSRRWTGKVQVMIVAKGFDEAFKVVASELLAEGAPISCREIVEDSAGSLLTRPDDLNHSKNSLSGFVDPIDRGCSDPEVFRRLAFKLKQRFMMGSESSDVLLEPHPVPSSQVPQKTHRRIAVHAFWEHMSGRWPSDVLPIAFIYECYVEWSHSAQMLVPHEPLKMGNFSLFLADYLRGGGLWRKTIIETDQVRRIDAALRRHLLSWEMNAAAAQVRGYVRRSSRR